MSRPPTYSGSESFHTGNPAPSRCDELSKHYGALGPTAQRVLATIAERMARAAETYGDDFDRPANWEREEQAEYLDAIVYRAVQIEKRKDGSVELNNRINNACQRALTLFGRDQQFMQTIQECGELIVAITQYQQGRVGIAAVAEEVAGVEQMMRQMSSIVGSPMRAAREQQVEKLEQIVARKEQEET